MTRKSSWICAFAALACLLALSSAGFAASPTIVGNELQANTENLSQLHNPVAAFDSTGRAMLVWENDLLGLRGRLYSNAGAAQGGELPLVGNEAWSVLPGIAPVTFHRDPAIAFLPSGNFLLAWAEERGTLEWMIYFENLQIASREIVVQLFNTKGQLLGQPVTVSSGGVGLKSRPQLAVLPNGVVVATWMSTFGAQATPASELGVFTRPLDGTGKPLAAQTQVDTVSGAVGSTPALAVNSDNSYVIAWSSQVGTDTFDTNVYARIFASSGRPTTAPIELSTGAVGPQGRPAVASDGQGSYLVAWQSYFNDVWHARIDGQIVSAAGGLLGKRLTLSDGAGKNWAEEAPSVAVGPGGSFVLVWMEYNTWFPVGMAAMQVDSTGASLGDQVWVNSNQINGIVRTSIAVDGAGHYLTPYEGFQNSTTVGILARYFSAAD